MAKDDSTEACIHFTIWLDGEKIKAGAVPDTTITVNLGSRVVGLHPTLTAEEKELRVALVSLKSEEQESERTELDVYEGPYGRIHSFRSDEKIRFSALRSSRLAKEMAITTPKPKGGQCCVALSNGYRICASCYVIAGGSSCCTSFWCCVRMFWDMVFAETS